MSVVVGPDYTGPVQYGFSVGVVRVIMVISVALTVGSSLRAGLRWMRRGC